MLARSLHYAGLCPHPGQGVQLRGAVGSLAGHHRHPSLLQLGAVLHTLRLHPLVVALPQSARLAPLAGALVYGAVAAELAAVAQLLGDGASEESLAALAGIGAAIVRPGGLGSTHAAWWDVALYQCLVSSAGLLGENRGGTLQLGLPLPLAALT